jgi:methylglutaconyl-CoA hydratase
LVFLHFIPASKSIMNKRVVIHIDADFIATILLNRPEVHNALDPEMVTELTDAMKALEANARVRAVVITGAGAGFCSGADINSMKKSAKYTPEENLRDAHRIAQMFHLLHTLKKPTIACIRGAVRGGGLGLVAAADIAVAARTATFRLSEVKLGIIPALISPYVIAAIGERMARRYMLSGEEFDSAEAYRIGLVHDIVEDEELNAAVGRMLAHLYSSGPQAVPITKKLIADMARAPLNEQTMSETARRMADIRATSEAQEGLSAFLEKRKAEWVTPATEKATSTKARKAPGNKTRKA